MELDDEIVAVPVGVGAHEFQGVIKANETAVSILKMLEEETTEETIIENLMKEYQGDRTMITSCVHEFIDELKAEGVVE